jgi:hypothetical protein
MISSESIIKNILAEILFEKRICESTEENEIVEYFYNSLLESKFLFGEPISVPELRKLLRKKIVNFEFIKLDGHVRPAKGTTMMKHIPREDHPKGIRPSSDMVATFFDLDKDAWRSVSKKSKEIVLKKDKEEGKPIVVVRDKDEKLRKKGVELDKLGPEPEDVLQVGDIRNYLNRNGKNIGIKITRIDDDGSIYAQTMREKTPFRIPAPRVRNIGEIIDPRDLDQYLRKSKVPKVPRVPEGPVRIPITTRVPPLEPRKPVTPEETEGPEEMKPVTPKTPEGNEGDVIELIPREESPAKKPPEDVEDRDDAEELQK